MKETDSIPCKILVVVPCYNEAERLPEKTILKAAASFPDLHFLFVDDGSSDATETVMQRMSDQMPDRIQSMRLEKNSGKAEAVRKGMLKGMESADYDYLGFLDADLSSPPEEIIHLKNYSSFRGGNHVFMFGSRIKLLGSDIVRNQSRHYFGRIAATAASVTLALPVYDTQCGVKLFRREVCLKLFEKPFLSRWLFDVEIFFRLKELYERTEFGDKILEVPLRVWKETPGTKLKLSDVLKVPLELWKIHREYNRFSRF